eukprot:3158983-Karenia_brevis.AAC.1
MAPVDAQGNHAMVCKFGGFKTVRHSRLVRLLRAILRESGASVAPREVVVPAWRRADGTNARLDVAFTVNGERKFVDVTVRHPLADKYFRRAAREDGAAASMAAHSKRVRYPALAAEGLLEVDPFCVETYGRLGSDALRVLRQARQRIAEREGGQMRGWAGTALFQRWLAL